MDFLFSSTNDIKSLIICSFQPEWMLCIFGKEELIYNSLQ